MGFFRSDLFRNLGLGFLMGALGVAIANPMLAQSVTALV